MLNIVIFGAPGSGKGTQSERIVEKYVSTISLPEMYCVQKLKTAQNWVKLLKGISIRDN